MTDQYAELHAEIARLRGDLDVERDVADKPRAFGPPTRWTIPATSRRYVSTTCWRPASSARPPIRTALGIGPMPATNDGAALEVFRAATVPAPLLQPAHDFATVRHTQPIRWRHSDEVSRDTNNAVLSVGEVALSGVRRRTRQEYRRQRSALQHR